MRHVLNIKFIAIIDKFIFNTLTVIVKYVKYRLRKIIFIDYEKRNMIYFNRSELL